MFNRRFYRIKTFQQLYAYGQDSNTALALHEKALLKSLDKTYELYIFLLSFAPEFRFFISKELDQQKSKFIPNHDSIAQLEALNANKALIQLEQSEELAQYIKHFKIKWTGADDLMRKVWQQLRHFKPVADLGQNSSLGFTDDKKLVSEIYQFLSVECELLDAYIEERYINWEDDQTWVMTGLLKTIEQLKENSKPKLQPFQHDKEVLAFMKDLLYNTVQYNDELTQLIASKTQNWDADRIAYSDMLLMKMALCEILYFPYIPVKVSINEYLELAKLYSTPQSHGFINGVLDKIQIELRNQNRIKKLGRGLVEN
jgi:N utilization substance protein B